ncbi:epimerase [Budviciaceae bacterium BWR-B9]|uniref:Epimerase n=1 Tax=Limnobaculum allomyrinae TaxID=2791986 RepID=A0ABS1ILD7_9GAMM|nr:MULTISPECIES: epimerase [Limnobaculum]MBK5142554.1 epimerase [Limnobaculum allomyrinae]MBV7690561.1 epimerase [Limnobaculum sp. M2-1]
MLTTIHPSLASASQLELGRTLERLNVATIGSIHLDIEDTSFIRNITFGLKTVTQVAGATHHPLSFHLMVSDPFPWIEWLKPVNPDWIFVHVETLANPAEILALVRGVGSKVGLAFNPATPLEPYSYLASLADSIMIMTSEPDGMGQRFNPLLIDKVVQATSLFKSMEIWADGGITFAAARKLYTAGARHLVLGRALFASEDYVTNVDTFREVGYER